MLRIVPQTVLLTSGQAVTFQTTDEQGNPVSVRWTSSPEGAGTIQPPSPAEVPSATFVAPTGISDQTVAVIASTDKDTASAVVSITPTAISIVPAEVELMPGQQQKFIAIVAGVGTGGDADDMTRVEWILSPPIGELHTQGPSRQEVIYTATDVPDTQTVTIIAASGASGKQAKAIMHLVSPPWTGRGVQLLGAYLLLVFTLVFLIVLLWPPALPSPETARADRIQAEKTLEDKTASLQKAENDLAKAKAKLAVAQTTTPANTGASQTAAIVDAQAELDTSNLVQQRADEAAKYAADDLQKKRDDEKRVNDPNVMTMLSSGLKLGSINRELDLLFLVLLSGALGAFLHMSQSFSDYIGNRTLKNSWAWWYYFRPFIGAGLALVFYAALRGGVMAIAVGANSPTAQINPFGLVSIGALVGMFSKAATMKLGEVFDTIFKSEKAQESKDKLTQAQDARTAATTGTASTAASPSSSTAAK